MNLVHTAYQTNVAQREFRCGGCGFASPVEVTGRGAGQTRGRLDGKDDAAAQAAEGAAEGAAAWVNINLQLCPCPKCGWRDPVYAVPFKRRAKIAIAVCAGICVVGSLLIPLGLPFAGGLVAFFGFISVIVAPLTLLSTWRGPRRNVKFLSA